MSPDPNPDTLARHAGELRPAPPEASPLPPQALGAPQCGLPAGGAQALPPGVVYGAPAAGGADAGYAAAYGAPRSAVDEEFALQEALRRSQLEK